MALYRIHKKYNMHSNGLAGIEEIDKVEFKTREDLAAFLLTVAKNPHVGYIVLDVEPVLVNIAEGAEVIVNPTGGYVGKIHDARQYAGRTV